MARRLEKLSEEIKREISHILRNEIKDPRISSMVSVTAVEVSRDLSHAKIYISLLGSEREKEKTLEGLQRARGFIRKELGRRVRMRIVPEITFTIDKSIEYGAYISELLEKVKEKEGTEQKDGNI